MNSSELKKPLQNPQSVQEVSKQRALGHSSKTHVDYWKRRIFKSSYTRDGKTHVVDEYAIKIQHRGIRKTFTLGTSNKDVAAAKARDIFATVNGENGWERALAKFAPAMAVSLKTATVGEFLAQIKAVSHLRAVTCEIYARKFRTLVAGVFNLRGGKEKFDYVNGGRAKWLERVHRVRLDKLTSQRIERWKVNYLKAAAAKDPLANKRAKTTVNSLIRGSKSLFAPSVVKGLTVCLPKPLPFDGVENVSLPRSRYKSEINPSLLLVQAQRELADADPECFKILLLALGAGLRRDEIDSLSWKQMEWMRQTIRVETTIHTAAKSDDSESEVDVDPGLMEIFKSFMAASDSEFVIRSDVAPKPNTATYHHYRCTRHFNRLIAWLRTKGVSARTPLHSLRKEFGSQICATNGIFAASVALRHSSIQITRDHYLDKKQRIFMPMGDLVQSGAPATELPKTEVA